MTDCFARAALGHSAAPPSSVMKSRRFNPSPRPRAVPVCPGADPNETGGVWERVSPEPRRPGIAAARGGLAGNERDQRLVAWLIFSRRFLGDFLEAWPRFSPCRPSNVNSPGAKRKMLAGRPATPQAIDHGSERRARPQQLRLRSRISPPIANADQIRVGMQPKRIRRREWLARRTPLDRGLRKIERQLPRSVLSDS